MTNYMNKNRKNIFIELEEKIKSLPVLSETKKEEMIERLKNLSNQEINILITGATGCGKSSTINALFDADVAEVGVGVDPMTMDIKKYKLKNMVLWDSPGLGDGVEADERHSENIIKKLEEIDNNKALIDLVLVILDGSTRDLGTSYTLINDVIIPHLGNEPDKRILVAINQCDIAMKGKYWNKAENCPEPQLEEFLKEKVDSVKRRIKEGTGVDVDPIYYSAGYKEIGEKQNPYNLTKLLYYIIEHTPAEKRINYIDNISKDENKWIHNDKDKNYGGEIKKSFSESVTDAIIGGKLGAEIGGKIGSAFGPIGSAVGAAIGSLIGGIFGFLF